MAENIRVQFIPFFSNRDKATLGWCAETAYSFHDYLGLRGFEFVHIRPDVIWAQNGPHMTEILEYATCPIVIDDHRDASMIPWNLRKWIKHPSVKILMKGGTYAPRALNNAMMVEATYHGHLTYHSAESAFPNIEPEFFSVGELSNEDMDKIRVIHSFEQLRRLDPLGAGPLDPEHRHFDVHFIGSTKYERETVAHHREVALKAVTELKQHNISVGSDRQKLRFKHYLTLLRQCKIVVSPWGFGERCHRDYEAILAGCMLVKPDTNWCETATDIFTPGMYHSCDHTFSDLQNVVDRILMDWDKSQDVREARRNKLIAERTIEAGARRVEACLREAIDAS